MKRDQKIRCPAPLYGGPNEPGPGYLPPDTHYSEFLGRYENDHAPAYRQAGAPLSRSRYTPHRGEAERTRMPVIARSHNRRLALAANDLVRHGYVTERQGAANLARVQTAIERHIS